MSTVIYGAGLAGLLAATAFQDAPIFEAGAEGSTTHKALLRFRTPYVGNFTSIDFRKVRVHKGVFYDGKFVQPDIRLSNMYSQKVIGKLADRSIWNLEAVDRYVAPEDFIEQLVDRHKSRIHYNHAVTVDDIVEAKQSNVNIISTIPMPVMQKIVAPMNDPFGLALHANVPEFKAAPINVERYRVKDADVFQTIYFPDPDTDLYRASITKDMLIAESVIDGNSFLGYYHPTVDDLEKAFGLRSGSLEPISKTKQSFGKIAPIDDVWRKQFQFRLTHDHGIYSLGRFGTWRNILLDDVLQDLDVVKKMMNVGSYDLIKQFSK